MDRRFWFFFILIILIAPLIIICAVVGAKDESRGKYDERQLAAQGTCFKAGFCTMLGYYILYFVLGVVSPKLMDFLGYAGAVTGAVIGGGVLAVLCIVKDAYIPPKANVKANLWMAAFLLFLYIINFLMRLGDGFVTDGRLNMTVVMLELMILFAGIFAAQMIKYVSDREREEP